MWLNASSLLFYSTVGFQSEKQAKNIMGKKTTNNTKMKYWEKSTGTEKIYRQNWSHFIFLMFLLTPHFLKIVFYSTYCMLYYWEPPASLAALCLKLKYYKNVHHDKKSNNMPQIRYWKHFFLPPLTSESIPCISFFSIWNCTKSSITWNSSGETALKYLW